MLLLSGSVARADESFPLVPGARWVARVPTMEAVRKDLLPLLTRAGKRAAYVSPTRQAVEWEETYGLPVLDPARWSEAGLDPAQGWTAFRTFEGEWISAGVKDATKVAAWLDRWARLRGLLHHEAAAVGLRTSSMAYARAKGSRWAAARVVSRDRVLVLVGADVRSVDLSGTWESLDEVVPAMAPVRGALVVWMRRSAARDVWVGVRPQSDGLDVDVRFSGIVPGWVSLQPRRSAWVTAALVPSPGVFRARATLGPEWAAEAAEELATAWKLRAGPAWLAWATEVATGPMELAGTSVFPERAGVHDGEVSWGRVFPGWVLMPERSASAVKAFVEATAAVSPSSPEIRSGWKGRVEADGRSLRLAIGDTTLPAPAPGAASSPFGDGCTTGHPVFAARFDGPAVARALDGVTLLGALRDEAVLAAWAIGAELGPLLRVSEPVTVVACAETSAAVDARLRWRFRE